MSIEMFPRLIFLALIFKIYGEEYSNTKVNLINCIIYFTEPGGVNGMPLFFSIEPGLKDLMYM